MAARIHRTMTYHVWALGILILTIGMIPAYAAPVSDIDDDGIPNSEDQCPHIPEDYDGDVTDGCPSNFVPWYDADYDAIQDHLDLCPTVRENYNLFNDADGCP
ncbi:MAG: thrombospondin, partial [Cenarchaeum sp. SB0663_bin_5]|nr:thrombospondin [Cenarchaeum sp. SB0663_bin_5]